MTGCRAPAGVEYSASSVSDRPSSRDPWKRVVQGWFRRVNHFFPRPDPVHTDLPGNETDRHIGKIRTRHQFRAHVAIVCAEIFQQRPAHADDPRQGLQRYGHRALSDIVKNMKTITIPDFGTLNISDIVCDYNGTLAVDGVILPSVSEAINNISDIRVHVITADTFGLAEKQLKGTNCSLTISPKENQAQWKLNYINSLNSKTTACIGNGRNDRFMLKESALGIALIQGEGASVETLMNANIVCTSIICALEYFSNPKRLIATLRS